MSYTKNTWVDQAGQVRYTETEDDGYKIFTANYEEVTTIGTPVNAANMNHIEDGIEDCDTAITNLQSQVTTLNNTVIKTSGNQTASGTKTFTGTVKVPNTTTTGTALALAGQGGSWIKLGDGTLIQWGKGATSNHYVTIDMWQSFSSAEDYRVQLTDTGENTSVTNFKVIEFTSAKKFKVYTTSSGSGDSFHWFAIGR